MPKYTPPEIYRKLHSVHAELSEKYNVFYVALYGSQNYGIDTENSDLDFKAIIIPTLEDLVNQTKPTSKVYTYEWWQVEIKDIRNYIESAVKVNVNFIELLSTPYYYSEYEEAKEFRSFFNPLLDEQGIIYLRACYWMIMQKAHALRHPFPSKLEVLEKFGYDPKQMCHIIRLTWLMNRYTFWDYSFLHLWQEKDELIEVKEWIINNENIDEAVKPYLDKAQEIIDWYTKEPSFETKYKLIRFSRDLIIKTITEWLKV